MKPEPRSTPQDPAEESALAWLSALADGQAGDLDRGCRLWREEEQARRAWHTYHLIGDVMRSDELAAPAARDADFMAGIHQRLAAEPVLLAASAPAAPQRRRWLVPAALAAGLAVVSGVLVFTQRGGASVDGAQLAAASSPRAMPQTRSLRDDQGVIHDARLDEFLRAHQAARGGVAVAVPGGALRRVEVLVPVGVDR